MIYPENILSGSHEATPDHAPTKQRVLVIEDQSAICDMIAEVVSSHPRCELIGKGGDGANAIRLAQQLSPDILVLDLIMPDLGGIEVLYRLRDKVPQMKVLIFSGMTVPSIIRPLMHVQVHGYVHKNERLAELRDALGALSSGNKWFKYSDNLSADGQIEPKENDDFSLLKRLTIREREIAVLITKSYSSKEVADILKIAQKTVENHRANLMRKLRVNDIAGVVRLIIRSGIC